MSRYPPLLAVGLLVPAVDAVDETMAGPTRREGARTGARGARGATGTGTGGDGIGVKPAGLGDW